MRKKKDSLIKNKWRISEVGVPQTSSSILDWDFPWTKPSSDLGVAHDYINPELQAPHGPEIGTLDLLLSRRQSDYPLKYLDHRTHIKNTYPCKKLPLKYQ